MTDTNTLAGTLDKATYNQGDTMKLTLGGAYVRTGTQPVTGLTVTAKLPDGTTTTVTAPTATVNTSTDLGPTAKLNPIVDSTGRAWTLSADGRSATATA